MFFRAHTFSLLPVDGSARDYNNTHAATLREPSQVAMRMAHAYFDNVFIRKPQTEFMACTNV